MAPCHNSPAGSTLAALLRDDKSIAVLRRDGSVHTSISFAGFTGIRGTATGLRQVVSTSGREQFYVAGIANSAYGVRYLERTTSSTTTRIIGATFHDVNPPRYQPATLDVRSAVIYGTQLFIASSYTVEPNVQSDQPGRTPWGGLTRVGAAGQLPNVSTEDATLVRGFDGKANYWSFVFEQAQSMWALEDSSRYMRAQSAAQLAFEDSYSRLSGVPRASADTAYSRPVFYRSSLSTTVVKFAWTPGKVQWVEDPSVRVVIRDACYSMTGRRETSTDQQGQVLWKHFVVYTTSRTKLYRVYPHDNSFSVVASAPEGQLFRGVSLPAYPSATPTPTPSGTPSRSRTRSRLSSRSRSGSKAKPRVL